jgi:hypothetical protein
MQEVLGRKDNPNRGNKAHLTYYPVLIALVAGWVPAGQPLNSFITDLVVRSTETKKAGNNNHV